MKKIQLFIVLIIAVLMTACAAKTVSKKSLKKPSVITQLELPTDYVYDKKRIYTDSTKVKGEYYYGVLAGTYVSEYEDKKGIYYRGTNQSVILYGNNSKGQKGLVPGGIWLPKEGKKHFRPYWYSHVGPENPPPQTAKPHAPIVPPSVPGAEPVAAVTGTVIAGAMVQSMIDADKNNAIFLPKPPADTVMIDSFEKSIKISAFSK